MCVPVRRWRGKLYWWSWLAWSGGSLYIAVSQLRHADRELSFFSCSDILICGSYKPPIKWAEHSWLANVIMCSYHVHNDDIGLVSHWEKKVNLVMRTFCSEDKFKGTHHLVGAWSWQPSSYTDLYNYYCSNWVKQMEMYYTHWYYIHVYMYIVPEAPQILEKTLSYVVLVLILFLSPLSDTPHLRQRLCTTVAYTVYMHCTYSL